MQCPECGVDLALGSLMVHHKSQNIMVWGDKGSTPHSTPPGEAHNYCISLPNILAQILCSVGGCLGRATNQTNLKVHFAPFHLQYTIVILEEGKLSYPQCLKCYMLLFQRSLNIRHPSTYI